MLSCVGLWFGYCAIEIGERVKRRKPWDEESEEGTRPLRKMEDETRREIR
jgi:hypothetical protein